VIRTWKTKTHPVRERFGDQVDVVAEVKPHEKRSSGVGRVKSEDNEGETIKCETLVRRMDENEVEK